MITITNKEMLDYLVKQIIKRKRSTPKGIQFDNNLKIVWKNGVVTNVNMSFNMFVSEDHIDISVNDYHGYTIAQITLNLQKRF